MLNLSMKIMIAYLLMPPKNEELAKGNDLKKKN